MRFPVYFIHSYQINRLPLQELQDINEQIQRYREDFEHTYNIQYGISEDCTNTCQYNDDFNSNSAYYMTGNFYLGAWITKGDCDMDAINVINVLVNAVDVQIIVNVQVIMIMLNHRLS